MDAFTDVIRGEGTDELTGVGESIRVEVTYAEELPRWRSRLDGLVFTEGIRPLIFDRRADKERTRRDEREQEVLIEREMFLTVREGPEGICEPVANHGDNPFYGLAARGA